MVVENEAAKRRKVLSYIQKLKSSVTNKYCLCCRTEISEKNHNCKEIESLSDKIVEICLEFKKIDKEIMDELNSEILKNEEFANNIKNKILAYSI